MITVLGNNDIDRVELFYKAHVDVKAQKRSKSSRKILQEKVTYDYLLHFLPLLGPTRQRQEYPES